MTLPKQWKHWCAVAGLRPDAKRTVPRMAPCHSWFYVKGRGRRWRVNDRGMFQCGDTHEDFDRWALCHTEEVPLPQSQKEFLQAVEQLLAAQERAAEARAQEVED